MTGIAPDPGRTTYLLVPMMPTPNGTLHLGHIAGPYLKMDVLARALRQRGHGVMLVTTTDAFETHVLQSAERLGRSPEDVCSHFHEAIRRDFEHFCIAFDAFVDPIRPPAADAFLRTHARLTDALHARGHVRRVPEPCLVDAQTGEPILGYRLSGKCPSCGSDTVGFVCEACGLQVTTEMLDLPKGPDGRDLAWEAAETLALRVVDRADLLRRIAATHLPSAFRQAMTEFVTREPNLIRLTTPGHHGVGRHRVGDATFTLYNTYFGHALFCGEIWSKASGADANAFAVDSGVVTVTSCGLDNATDLTSCMAFAQAYDGFKGFDHHLGNFFLTLDGTKFSTSLGHAVFVADLAARPRIDVDALRFYLADISPQDGMRDFTVGGFVDFHASWFSARLGETLQRARRAVAGGSIAPLRDGARGRLEAAMGERDRALSFEAFSLPAYADAVRRYCDAAGDAFEDAGDAYFWLQGLAILAEPLMPSLCRRLWAGLGQPGRAPDLERPFALPATPLRLELPPFAPIAAGDFP